MEFSKRTHDTRCCVECTLYVRYLLSTWSGSRSKRCTVHDCCTVRAKSSEWEQHFLLPTSLLFFPTLLKLSTPSYFISAPSSTYRYCLSGHSVAPTCARVQQTARNVNKNDKRTDSRKIRQTALVNTQCTTPVICNRIDSADDQRCWSQKHAEECGWCSIWQKCSGDWFSAGEKIYCHANVSAQK